MAKTLKPSRSSLERTSLAAAASTVRVTISPAGVPKRQMNSAIFRFGVYHAVIGRRDDHQPRTWSQFASRSNTEISCGELARKRLTRRRSWHIVRATLASETVEFAEDKLMNPDQGSTASEAMRLVR